jgi:hypothetical protein
MRGDQRVVGETAEVQVLSGYHGQRSVDDHVVVAISPFCGTPRSADGDLYPPAR